ncbi:hypothetical protein E8E11_007289 [Didymella keratinophila]|nr:hypothetical protein E8E11_007289 [Didymella keratinophila]
MASQNYIRGRSCYPNGPWKEMAGATWRIMDSTYFFTPNLCFENMTFTQVKVIDIAWDLLVGRGGQMGLVMFISALYVFAFSTLMAAMTGYITTYEPYFEDNNQNLVEWSKLDEVVRTIDASGLSIGFDQGALQVTAKDEDLTRTLDVFIAEYAAAKKTLTNTWSDARPVKWVGDDGSGIRSKNYTIDPGVNWEFEKAIWTLDETMVVEVPVSTGKPLRDLVALVEQYYGIGGRYGSSYGSTWLRSHSTCKPSGTYQWGFSYVFLFVVSIFNFLWSFIMIAMWLDTRRGSCMYKRH